MYSDWVEDCEQGWLITAFFNMCGGSEACKARFGNGESCQIGSKMREVVAED